MMLFSSDSLTNITSPLDLDSLFYWFAADVGVTDSLGGAIATDEGVGTWNDLSGNGYHVTQTTNGARPVYKATGGPGSKPCIQFDGSNDFLASAAHWWGSDDITFFVVMKFGNATRDASEVLLGKYETVSPANTRQWLLTSGPTSLSYRMRWVWTAGGGTTIDESSFSAKSTSFQCLVLATQGSNATTTARIDGASQTMTDRVPGVTLTTIYNAAINLDIGAIGSTGGTVSSFLQGSISEIIVYSRDLTATERAAIENYLNKKYDLY